MASLNRQDSASSASSAGSGMSAASSMAAGGDGVGGGAGDLTETNAAIQKLLFGFLVTLFKQRWEDSKRFLVGRVLLEHLQLILVLLQAQFFWTFDMSYWLWQIANYSLIKPLTLPAGYTAYAAVVYVMTAIVGCCLLACGWVAWRFNKSGVVPNKWPVKLLRLVMAVVFKVFYITVLNYLLGPLNCSWLATAKVRRNVDFPAQNCLAMPHLTLMVVSAVTALIVIAVSGLMALAEVTPNPVSQNWLAAAHSEVEMKTWVFKTAIVIAANILVGHYQVQSIIILIAAGWIVYIYIRYQPYLFAWVNHLRTGAYAMTAHVALLLTINLFAEDTARLQGYSAQDLQTVREARSAQLTLYMLVLLPAALVVGTALSWLRLRLWVRPVLRKFRGLDMSEEGTNVNLKDVHKFVDEYEVELVARCCRHWDDYEDNIVNPDAIALADCVIKAGLARFPTSAHMVLVYINFLSSVQNNQQACNSQLQAARKLQANMCDRYVFYVREQQQLALLQANAGQNAESGVDLVGYVEFQRNFKQVLRAHKSALFAIKSFWKQLLHSSIPFSSITRAFARIEATRSNADRAYQTMLERYPSNIKVLRAYGRFLEGVLNDPWAASKYFAEADRLEEMEGAEAAAGLVEEAGDGIIGVDTKANAVCVINAQGIIQMANKPLLKMFGYKKGEIEGKNISLLMPQPFSSRHNGFLRNYITTGKAKILNTVREVVALHKDHYVFPLTIAVTKASGSGADAIFMGILRPLDDEPDTVKAWLMPAGGLMLCVDLRFSDWFGLTAVDCLDKPFTSLSVEPEALTGLLERAVTASPEDLEAGLVEARDVLVSHKHAGPLRVDITIRMGGTDAERLYVAVIRKRPGAESSDHLMVADKRGRIMYITTQLANLLGVQHPKSLFKVEYTRFMAQPFMQLHNKWMKDMPHQPPLCSCRSGMPVVLITQQRTPVSAKLEISTKEQGGDTYHIVKVKPVTFKDALIDRRVSLRIDAHGDILSVSDTPAQLFGFKPQMLVGRNLSNCLDIFTGLPATGGAQGLDMEHVLTELVHKCVEQKDSSWRCGMHPPMTTEEVMAAKSNVVQANMLANQTKAALLQLEVELTEDDEHAIASITAHIWRAEMLTGVVEVDKGQIITKAGCCPLHQPGHLFGVPSGVMMHTTLAHWLSVPPTYDGLLLDIKKKGGALKRKASDIKIGPLLHTTGNHFDGDKVKVSVQAVVKEGTGGAGRLVVKLTMDKPSKGNPNFARRLLGLPELQLSSSGNKASALAVLGGLVGQQTAAEGGAGAEDEGDGQGGEQEDEGGASGRAARPRGGVHFGGGDGEEEGQEKGGSDDEPPARTKSGKNDRLMEWVKQASGIASHAAATAVGDEDDAGIDPEESTNFMAMPPTQLAGDTGFGYVAPPDAIGVGDDTGSRGSGVDEDASRASGSEAGGAQSDFQRGRRLRKLARMLNSKPAQKFATRFYSRTVAVIGLLLVAHLACFIASVVMLDAQKQYIDEVDDAGVACIAMHRMAIDCRVLDALYKNIGRPGIFTQADFDHFVKLTENAIEQFEHAHEDTYLGRNNVMRRFFNRRKYKLRDYWELPMWETTQLLNTTPPVITKSNMSLWTMGNMAVLAAREVLQNHAAMTAGGIALADNPYWYFVMENAPNSLHSGYRSTLYGLVERAMAKIQEVRNTMIILLALEGCGLFLIATLYVAYLVHKMVAQRADLFSVFLVIPTGFLRALASKQVQLDEDDDSDNDSDIGELQGDAPQQQQQQEKQEATKLNLNLGGKKAALAKGGKGKQQPTSWLARISEALNPVKWIMPKAAIDTGKRQLLRNSKDMLKLCVPLMLWGIIVIIVYGTSMQQLEQVHGPFQMLNIINFLVFRITRTVLYSLEAVLAPTADTAKRLVLVGERLENLRTEYLSFLYGFQAVGGNAAPTDLSTNDAGLFKTAELANIFFRSNACLRKDQSECYPPGHLYYTVTRSGLDPMFQRFQQEGQRLIMENVTNVNINNPHFEYLWQVGRADLFDGMTSADKVFRLSVQGMFDSMRVAQITVFVISLAWAMFLWLGLARPMLRRSGKESRQIAEMLSQLPPEMDVEGLVAQAIARTGDEDEQKAGGASGNNSSNKRLQGAGGSSGKGLSRRQAGNASGGGRQSRQQADDDASDAETDM